MMPTTFLSAFTAFTLFSRAIAIYTSADDFITDLPKCIRDCNMEQYNYISEQCTSGGLDCFCLAYQAIELEEANTMAIDAAQCSLNCPESDQEDSTPLIMEFAQSCLPYFAATNNETSTASSASLNETFVTATSRSSTTAGSSATGILTGGDSTELPNATSTSGVTPTASVPVAGATETGAGSVLGVNAVFVVPVVLAALFA